MRCDWIVLARMSHQYHGRSGVEICVNDIKIPTMVTGPGKRLSVTRNTEKQAKAHK